MFWKDLSRKVQAEAMGRSSQTTSLSFRPLGSLRDWGSSAILGPATVCSKGVTLNSWEKGEVPVGVGVEWR